MSAQGADTPRTCAEAFRLCDLGSERMLAVWDREYRTYYSERVIRMLIERKGIHRAPLYFPCGCRLPTAPSTL